MPATVIDRSPLSAVGVEEADTSEPGEFVPFDVMAAKKFGGKGTGDSFAGIYARHVSMYEPQLISTLLTLYTLGAGSCLDFLAGGVVVDCGLWPCCCVVGMICCPALDDI